MGDWKNIIRANLQRERAWSEMNLGSQWKVMSSFWGGEFLAAVTGTVHVSLGQIGAGAATHADTLG